MGTTLQDLRLVLRQCRRSPGFVIGVVLVLALGIGANAGMFTVLEATLFRPLPYQDPGELVHLSITDSSGKPSGAYLADILAWRSRTHTLKALGYFNVNPAFLATDLQQATARQVLSVSASPDLFSTLGVSPAMGRAFTPEEQQPGRGSVALLSDGVWRDQFHADPGILGHVVRLDGVPLVVIGIMPAAFFFPADSPRAQVWIPVTIDSEALTRTVSESPSFLTIARRRDGASPTGISTELTSLQREFVPLYSNSASSLLSPARVSAESYRGSLGSRQQRSALLALLVAVAVLWLIAFANVAGLMLARSAARGREVALRSALGATRGRLVRQSLTESLVLSLAGAVAGLAMAEGTLLLMQHRLTAEFGSTFRGAIGTELTLHPDLRVLAALLLLTLLSAFVLGLIPPFLASGKALDGALRQDGVQAGRGQSQHRLQKVLIVSELALTLALLFGCSLLLRSVLALRRVPLGFQPDHVYVISPNLPEYKYAQIDPNVTVYKPLLTRLQSLPGVQASAITTVAPLDKSFRVTFSLYLGDGDSKSRSFNHLLVTQLRASGPELQQVLHFRMLRGRYFNTSDTPDSQPVAVVNGAFARLYGASGGDVMRFALGEKGRRIRIVGIIDDFHQKGIGDPAEPELDINADQIRRGDTFYQPTLQAHAQLMLRSTRAPADLLPEIRHSMQQLDPDLSSAAVVSMDQVVDDSMGSQLLATHLFEMLGGLALAIALAGLYSLLSYLVTLRTRELGLRIALGARRAHIVSTVLRSASALLFTGVAVGFALSLAARHLLQGLLFGTHVHDSSTLLIPPMLLFLVGLLAASVPARRAAFIEPLQALRSE